MSNWDTIFKQCQVMEERNQRIEESFERLERKLIRGQSPNITNPLRLSRRLSRRYQEDDGESHGNSKPQKVPKLRSFEEIYKDYCGNDVIVFNSPKKEMENKEESDNEVEEIICNPEQVTCDHELLGANIEEIKHDVNSNHEDDLLSLESTSEYTSSNVKEVISHEEILDFENLQEIVEEDKVMIPFKVQDDEKAMEIDFAFQEIKDVPISNDNFLFPNNFFDVSLTKFQISQVLQVLHVIKERSWQACALFLLLQYFKTRGRVFSNKGGMMHTKEASYFYKFMAHDSRMNLLKKGGMMRSKIVQIQGSSLQLILNARTTSTKHDSSLF